MIDDTSITNHSYQIIEGCLSQQPRYNLTLVAIEGNGRVVLHSGK
jgi:hypothetical protein